MTIPYLTHTLLAQPVFWSGAHLSSSHLQGCPTGKTSNKNIQVLITNKQHCKHQPNSCLFPPPQCQKEALSRCLKPQKDRGRSPRNPCQSQNTGMGVRRCLFVLCNVLAQGLVPRLTIPQTGNAARRGLEARKEGAPCGFLVHGGRAGGGEAQSTAAPRGKRSHRSPPGLSDTKTTRKSSSALRTGGERGGCSHFITDKTP